VVAVIDSAQAFALMQMWRELAEGQDAAIIGTITSSTNRILLRTELGGERILDELEDDPLPRIC
jgi:hydrogenase expression/formation protein HypE